ncbi:hypothetical protein HRH25_22060 [Flavisolibacter sp. BT320]|nr:hypothetical protein [Flavisolibacter longurius]
MRVFLSIAILLFSIFSLAQDKEANAIRFAVTCAAGAQTSPEIETFKQLHEQKDYKTIREKLFAGSPMEQVLSAMLLKHYSSTGVIEASKQEKEIINQIAKSKRRFFFCFTCTSSEEGTLKQLFAGRKHMTYELVKGTILNSF